MKFGISYSAQFMNQGAALLSVYRDGSIHVSHGGTEMGQGIHTKILQIVAHEFGLPLSRIRVTTTATDRVPNTVPTSGSLGTDLNGMAVVDAARKIKARLAGILAPGCPPAQVHFSDGRVQAPGQSADFAELAERAFKARVSLSATGFYRTPHVHWDRAAGQGSPYLYYAYGASCSEVAVDTLTGEYRVLRTDILQDVGHSINRDIDLGQIEGGFMQGLGWCTTEELCWDAKGRLTTHGAIDLQDSAGLGPARRAEHRDRGMVGQCRPHGHAVKGRGRTAGDAGPLGAVGTGHGGGLGRRLRHPAPA